MNKDNPKTNILQAPFPDFSRRETLDKTRLSRLPEHRPKFQLPNFETISRAEVCVNCKTKLNEFNKPMETANVCRACLRSYAVIDAELESSEKAARRRKIQEMAGGENGAY